MSLVGSLEDLGLADILQIVSLSRKSGMLMLRSEGGEGRIVLRDGLVQGAAIKGEAEDLRNLLVDGGFVEGGDFDRAREAALSGDRTIDEVLARECGLAAERLESLRREHVERAVLRMFSWRSGEFSFEIREDLTTQDEELLLPSGLNTQYLAMEATRLRDEHTRTPSASEAEAEPLEPVFSGEEPPPAPNAGADETESASPEPFPPASATTDDVAAVEALAFASARQADAGGWADAEEEAGSLPEAQTVEAPLEATGEGVEVVACEVSIDEAEPVADTEIPVARGEEPAGPRTASASEASSTTPIVTPADRGRHLVVVDSDLSALEWFKASVEGIFQRVHIFQRTEIAIDRIRQYLVRGVIPLVIVSDQAQPDIGVSAFLRRLRNLAPNMRILAVRFEGSSEELPRELDGLVFRPSSVSRDPERWHLHDASARRLRQDLESCLEGARVDGAHGRARNALARLKHVSDRLRDPSTQGEVLRLVLEFAAETFSRVAMFVLRDDVAAGIAQVGLSPTGGPDDEGMRAIELGAQEMPEIFRRVLEKRAAVRAVPTGSLDARLVSLLGAARPNEAYVAPIESGGCVVALVYADNLPEEAPITDTTALEIVLHEAGLALDRALLERALAERD